ncbi:TetR/AcrR family transcriptional regulator [Psychrobacillus sp. NPDC096623]|uniref:TetR/AcrR family transcriptional regulator n=1 Tax=Psychrobacillus sp. NPDC096623 TaxID=3364492 RepID=UPI003824F4EA
MKSKQEQRSDETKKLILDSAANLFAKKGYDAVTIREIARDAGCSHTAIYLYFKDKETLLHQLSLPPLQQLYQKLQGISELDSLSSESRLKEISLEYISFCLKNRSMYDIFFNAKSSRVDEKPELEINQLRIAIFELLKSTIHENFTTLNEKQLLAFSRIYYYQLNGVLSTYSYQHEPHDVLIERLIPTFNLAIEILLLGFQEKLK